MSAKGDESRYNRNREEEYNRTSARHLATVGLYALANYKEAGLVQPGERMHGQLASRLAGIVIANRWEE